MSRGYSKQSILDTHEAFLLSLVEAEVDIMLDEMGARLRAERGIAAARVTIWRFFDWRGLTFKKKMGHAAEQDHEDVHAARLAWIEGQPDLDLRKLIFIDETWLNTRMARLRGRALRGERLRASLPHGHWKTITFIGGHRLAVLP